MSIPHCFLKINEAVSHGRIHLTKIVHVKKPQINHVLNIFLGDDPVAHRLGRDHVRGSRQSAVAPCGIRLDRTSHSLMSCKQGSFINANPVNFVFVWVPVTEIRW